MAKTTNKSVPEGVLKCCAELAVGSQLMKRCVILSVCFSSGLVLLVKLEPFCYDHSLWFIMVPESVRYLLEGLGTGWVRCHYRSLRREKVAAPIELSRTATCFSSATSLAVKYSDTRSRYDLIDSVSG